MAEVDITTIIGCPMRCYCCPQDVLLKAYKGKERMLSFDNFKLACDKIPPDVNIVFAGMAEPWLNPRCTDMLLYAHNTGHTILVYTTAVGMSLQDLERIKHVPFDFFNLHLPDFKGRAHIPKTKKQYDIIMDIYNAKLSNFKASCMDSPYIEFINFKPISQMHPNSRAGNVEFDTIKRIPRRKGVIRCGREKEPKHIEMLPDGNVYICCQDYALKENIGNLFTDNYDDLFKSKGYKKIIDGLKDDTLDIICRYCEWGIPEKTVKEFEEKEKNR